VAAHRRVDRLESALIRLSEAGARADERLERLEAVLERLAEAQLRTEERVGRLEEAVARLDDAVGRLAEAQLKTEERVGRLEEAVARLDDAVGRLAEAQLKTEERVGRLEETVAALAEEMRHLARQVGRLSESVGFTLEELARELGPSYLAQRFGIHVQALERRFFTADGEEVEVDIYGEGTRDGERVAVIGEVRSRIYGRDVEALLRRLRVLAPQLPGTPVPVLFGFVIHPSALEVARRTGALVIAAAGRP